MATTGRKGSGSRWAARLVTAVVVSTSLAAACGGGSSDETDTTTGEGSTTTTAEGSTTTTEPGGDGGPGTTGGERVVRVDYPGGGPVDNMLPLNEDAYGYVERRDCATLKARAESWGANEDIREQQGSAIDLYHGAAAACLLMWSTAETELAKVKSSDVDSCNRRATLAFLRAMVDAHERDPDVVLDFRETGSSCPQDEDDPPETTEPDPDDTTATTRSSTTTTSDS